MNYSTDNTRIIDRRKVPAPYELVNKYPINDDSKTRASCVFIAKHFLVLARFPQVKYKI